MIASQFAALCDTGETTSSSQKQQTAHVKSRNMLMFHGQEVCLPVFLSVSDIDVKRYKLLKKRYLTSGIQHHSHGKTGRPTAHALVMVYSVCEQILRFIKQVSEQFGLVLPGHFPGSKAAKLVLLPSSLKKRELHRKYSGACAVAGVNAVGYISFCRIWKQGLPITVIQKPKSDLCSASHRLNRHGKVPWHG